MRTFRNKTCVSWEHTCLSHPHNDLTAEVWNKLWKWVLNSENWMVFKNSHLEIWKNKGGSHCYKVPIAPEKKRKGLIYLGSTLLICCMCHVILEWHLRKVKDSGWNDTEDDAGFTSPGSKASVIDVRCLQWLFFFFHCSSSIRSKFSECMCLTWLLHTQ